MDRAFDNSTDSGVLLSIITVTHNDADRLSTTIQSLSHFYGDARYEHIVVDGGSIDQTTEVIGSLAHTSNFKFYSDLDKGIYDAMNRGIQRSCGKFMLFLNCGDHILVSPDDLANYFCEFDHKQVQIICFAFTHVDGGRGSVVRPQKAKLYKLPTSHQGMIFLSNFVRTYFYDTRYKIAADYDLYLHAQLSQIICASVKEPLTAVEIDGVASSNPVISYKEYLAIAFRNLHGLEMLTSLVRIGCRAILVVSLKLLLPQGWIKRMRSKT